MQVGAPSGKDTDGLSGPGLISSSPDCMDVSRRQSVRYGNSGALHCVAGTDCVQAMLRMRTCGA